MSDVVARSKFRFRGLIMPLFVIPAIVTVVYNIIAGVADVLVFLATFWWLGLMVWIPITAVSAVLELILMAVLIFIWSFALRYALSYVKVTETGLFGRCDRLRRFSLLYSEIAHVDHREGITIFTMTRREGRFKQAVYKIDNVKNPDEIMEAYETYRQLCKPDIVVENAIDAGRAADGVEAPALPSSDAE